MKIRGTAMDLTTVIAIAKLCYLVYELRTKHLFQTFSSPPPQKKENFF